MIFTNFLIQKIMKILGFKFILIKIIIRNFKIISFNNIAKVFIKRIILK